MISWARLEKSGVQGKLGPKLNEEKTAEYWYAKAEKDGNVAPQRKLANEKPQGVTQDYDELIKSWKAEVPHKKNLSRLTLDERGGKLLWVVPTPFSFTQ